MTCLDEVHRKTQYVCINIFPLAHINHRQDYICIFIYRFCHRSTKMRFYYTNLSLWDLQVIRHLFLSLFLLIEAGKLTTWVHSRHPRRWGGGGESTSAGQLHPRRLLVPDKQDAFGFTSLYSFIFLGNGNDTWSNNAVFGSRWDMPRTKARTLVVAW